MLEEVRIQFTFVQLYIRLYIVVEYDDVQIDTLFSQDRCNEIQDLRVRNFRSTDVKRYFFHLCRLFGLFISPVLSLVVCSAF